MLIMLVALTFSVAVIYRLYQIQVVDHAVMAEQAAGQHYSKITVQPQRGEIFDRNGGIIAGTSTVYRVGITPKNVLSRSKKLTQDEIVAELSSRLSLDLNELKAQVARKDATYIQLKKDVPSEIGLALRDWVSKYSIGGIRLDAEAKRFYTNGQLASDVIGFARNDSGNLQGALGLEYQFNEQLTGTPGYRYALTDNFSSHGVLPYSNAANLPAVDGYNINTTLDMTIQKIVHEELDNAATAYGVTEGASAVVMNPFSGDILAMESWPYFSSDHPAAAPSNMNPQTWDPTEKKNMDYLQSSVWRNAVVSDTYEPGSTFKAITAAAAFEENLVNEATIFSDAPLQVSGHTIRCHTITGHGNISVERAMWHSCNPVYVQVAQKLGIKRYYDYVRAFGFMSPTGIDLPAEASGLFHTRPTAIDLATLSFGESSVVTPLQLTRAFATFANGGNLVRPRIVRDITDDAGHVIQKFEPTVERQVISTETAARLRNLLRGVVQNGSSYSFGSEGYDVGGKTSTAVDEINEMYTFSFAEIAPIDQPELVVLVILNKPSNQGLNSFSASRAANRIVSRTMEYLGHAREYSKRDVNRITQKVSVPQLVGKTYAEAAAQLLRMELVAAAGTDAVTAETKIQAQAVAKDTAVHRGTVIHLYGEKDIPKNLVAVPNFSGMNYHESIQTAASYGLNVLITGPMDGTCKSQNPAATYQDPQVSPPESGTPSSSEGTSETTGPDAVSPTPAATVTPTVAPTPGQTPPTAADGKHVQLGSFIELVFETEGTGR